MLNRKEAASVGDLSHLGNALGCRLLALTDVEPAVVDVSSKARSSCDKRSKTTDHSSGVTQSPDFIRMDMISRKRCLNRPMHLASQRAGPRSPRTPTGFTKLNRTASA